MLAYILTFVLGLAPALQSVFDLPLQLALQQGVLAACLAWLFLRAFGEGLPRGMASRRFYPLWTAAALSLLSVLFSPFRGWIFNEWGNYGVGILIFYFASFLTARERDRVQKAVLWGAWLLFALCLLQAFALGNFQTQPPLTNLNALALYAVMIMPAALERKAWPLAVAMLVLVIWTQSVGAVLALLAAAGFYAVSRRGGHLKENGLLLAGLAVMAVALFYLLQADSVAGRITWWRVAWRMFSARPLTGFGHAAFTWAQAGFQPFGAFREHSIYAHNYYLEFLAENGLPAAAAWFWLLFSAVRSRSGLVKYGLIAALAHSLVDFGLSVPADFWLFCWLLSSPAEEAGVFRPSRRAAAAALAFALPLCAALGGLDLRSLAFGRACARAGTSAEAGDFGAAESCLAPFLRSRLFREPALEVLAGLSAGDKSAPPGFKQAVYWEEALLENRYAPAPWAGLREIYSAPGLQKEASGLDKRLGEVYR